MSTIMPVFKTFPEEGSLIGALLAGYGKLEMSLCSCVGMGIDDLDMAVKAMFRARGEYRRIDIADVIGRKVYARLGLEDIFSEAISAMHHCRTIRNKFSHCNFYDDNTGTLAFVNMEELAKQSDVVTDFGSLSVFHVSVDLLNEQDAYFRYVDGCMSHINYEGRLKRGKLNSNPYPNPPTKVDPPALHVEGLTGH